MEIVTVSKKEKNKRFFLE